ncbi:DUF4266 domain-containing protein [Thalassomonas sp. M1454]|uniref:DUF4266 domain-containing protein n=1 Tax=Thalassomonas sp. M1454 TaxID=2594477 RepID=UPI0021B0A977|nr:DUF4266 domain-containing protein [Thalassomonas sp. M1454]
MSLIALFSSACTTVQPWERANLAKNEMAINSDPMQAAFSQHVYTSKESTSGSSSGAGGGCGCN